MAGAARLERWDGGLVPLPRLVLLAMAGMLFERASGAYFLVDEGTEKCFAEEMLAHQVLRMFYSMKDKQVLHESADEKTRSQCGIIVKNPSGDVIKEHALGTDNHEDALAVVTQEEGAHRVCLQCTNQEWLNFNKRKMRWSIVFDVIGSGGFGETDPTRLATLARWKGTQAGVDDVMARLAAIGSENDYEKQFEAKFVHTSESVNTDVAAFKVFQIILIAVITAFQLHNLVIFLRKSHLDCTSCLPMRAKAGPTA